MKYLRLTYLRVVIRHSVLSPGAGDTKPGSHPVEPNAASDFLQHVVQDADLYPAAIRLLNAMPTLQYVSLTNCGQRRYSGAWKYWHSSKAWRVVEMDRSDTKVPGGSVRPSGARP